jgi:hypothetical protein
MDFRNDSTGYIDSEEPEERDAADIAEDFSALLSDIACPVDTDELIAALATLSEIWPDLALDEVILSWQLVVYLIRSGSLPDIAQRSLRDRFRT